MTFASPGSDSQESCPGDSRPSGGPATACIGPLARLYTGWTRSARPPPNAARCLEMIRNCTFLRLGPHRSQNARQRHALPFHRSTAYGLSIPRPSNEYVPYNHWCPEAPDLTPFLALQHFNPRGGCPLTQAVATRAKTQRSTPGPTRTTALPLSDAFTVN